MTKGLVYSPFQNKIYGEKHIPMIALWCHHSVIMVDFLTRNTTAYYSYYFDYLLFLLF